MNIDIDIKIKNLINEELQNCIIIEEAKVTYAGKKVVDFQTRYTDGCNFTHKNGDRYGLAFLNAFTEKGRDKILEAINSFPSKRFLNLVKRTKNFLHVDQRHLIKI